ncbi:MAG: transcriptional regulator, partial [Methyloversatilis sp. 12-65-5]
MNARTCAPRSDADEVPAGSLHRARLLVTTIARGSRRGSLLTELVARTGLPRPTIHRVLDMLIDMGWVERDPVTLRFNLGRDLAALGYSAISRQPVERAAATELSALAEELDQVVFLNIR